MTTSTTRSACVAASRTRPQESARRWFESRVVPSHREWEAQGHVPRDLWREAGAQGLLCPALPESLGGAGGSILHAAVVWEEQAVTGCTGPGFSLHSDIVAPYILHYGSDAQK